FQIYQQRRGRAEWACLKLGFGLVLRGTLNEFRSWRSSGRDVLLNAYPLSTRLYGPAVLCKVKVENWRELGFRVCIRPLNGAFMLLAIMDIRAHPILFSDRP